MAIISQIRRSRKGNALIVVRENGGSITALHKALFLSIVRCLEPVYGRGDFPRRTELKNSKECMARLVLPPNREWPVGDPGKGNRDEISGGRDFWGSQLGEEDEKAELSYCTSCQLMHFGLTEKKRVF